MADDPSALARTRTAEFEGPSSPSRARDVARGFLVGLTRQPGREAAAAVVLAVCELVTNAARHAGGTITLTLTAGSDAIEIAVSDRSSQLPVRREPDFAGGGGFGWTVVHSLASSVTTTFAPRRREDDPRPHSHQGRPRGSRSPQPRRAAGAVCAWFRVGADPTRVTRAAVRALRSA
ncbi:ATP-binding protein [Streptomyces vietnamensis]|uniref:ATP-binding protein n=1 Tax=Streptomyces vietnamensis TaxID=362257 RepID=UPI0037B5751E